MIKLKPIIPKLRLFDPAKHRTAIDAGMREAADEALEDFRRTTSTWSRSVSFEAKKQADGYLIGTDDDVWGMLDKGTKPHSIVAKKRALRFPGGYRAKTRPGFIGSSSGGPSGGMVFRKRVFHPGTKARSWSTLIGKKWRARLGPIVQKKISEAMR